MSARHTCLAELLGTAALLCAVIGSGIMAENLAGGNVAVALLAYLSRNCCEGAICEVDAEAVCATC